MKEDFTEYLKSAVALLNEYDKSRNTDLFAEIELVFQKFFKVNTVKIWIYDDRKSSISLLGSNDEKSVSLDTSITKYAVNKKTPVLVNHITSNKYYNQKIDNPLDLKIRAFMLYPVLKNNKTIGIINFFREIKQKKIFTKQDENNLHKFGFFWERLMKKKPVKKEELLKLIGEYEGNRKKEVKKLETAQKPSKKIDNAEDLKKLYEKSQKEVESYKQQFEEKEKLLKKEMNHVNTLKLQLKEHKKNEKIYKSQYTEGQESLKMLAFEYEKMNEDKDKEYLEDLKHLKEDLESIKKENKELKEKKNNVSNISLLKSQKKLNTKSSFSQLDENIEFLLQAIVKYFGDNEYSFMLLEMMIFSLESTKGMSLIEEKIKESKLISAIIKDSYFNNSIKMKNEKVMISKVVEHIESFESTVFLGACKIKVEIKESVPASLVFDMPKTYSVIYHLMNDLYQFVDPSKNVKFVLSYKDKFLKIKISAHTNMENSLIKSIFKKAKKDTSEKDRLGLQLSRKITERLKGKLDVESQNEKYFYTVVIPSQKIKM